MLIEMNGVWTTPAWEAAKVALEKLESEKQTKSSSGSDEKSPAKSTSASSSAAGATTTVQSTMSYNPSFCSQYYAAYQHLYSPYGMYGFSPYGSYGYMPFVPSPQQMQPPPPPPLSAKSEPESEAAGGQSQIISTTAVSVSADATSSSNDSTAKAGQEVSASTAHLAQNTWPNDSSADASSAGYSYSGSYWQPSVGMVSSMAGMSPQFQNMSYKRPRSSGVTSFQGEHTAAAVTSGLWQHPATSTGAMRPSRLSLSPSSATPSLRWSNSPRVNPYDGSFRQAVPRHTSEPYCPFDPTESEGYEDKLASNEHFGGFTPAPDAGNFRFRMPNRGRSRPVQWQQQSSVPRPRFNLGMQTHQRGPMQQSPQFRYAQNTAQQRVARPELGNISARPVIMPRVMNYSPRARAPWNASPDTQRVPEHVTRPSEMQESRWDKEENESNRADAGKSNAGPSAASGAMVPASADEWPSPLKNYVHRCFGSVKDEHSQDMMEAKLKALLTAAFESGSALTHDWDNEPIPDILNSSASFGSLSSSDSYRHSPSNLRPPRNFRFAGSLRGRRGTPSSSGRRGREGWSPPGFRRKSRSRSRSRKSRSRSSSRSSSSSRHSSRSRRRRHRRRRRNR